MFIELSILFESSVPPDTWISCDIFLLQSELSLLYLFLLQSELSLPSISKSEMINITSSMQDAGVLAPQWIERPPGIREVMGSIPVGDSEFFFVPRSCHVDQFTFHISLPSFKFTIFKLFTYHLHFCLVQENCLRVMMRTPSSLESEFNIIIGRNIVICK